MNYNFENINSDPMKFIKNSKKDIIKTVNSLQKIKISNYDLGIRKNFLNKKFTWAKVYDEIEKY